MRLEAQNRLPAGIGAKRAGDSRHVCIAEALHAAERKAGFALGAVGHGHPAGRAGVAPPRVSDSEHPCDPGQDLGGADVAVDDPAAPLCGCLDEQRHRRDLTEVGGGRVAAGNMWDHRVSMVCGHHDQRPAPEPGTSQARDQLAQQVIGEAGLQHVALEGKIG
jgi:hypothetical protein